MLLLHVWSLSGCSLRTVELNYDRASNIILKFNGAQAHIKSVQPKAIFVHRCSHRLNLSHNATYAVPEFRIPIENVKQLGIILQTLAEV